MTSWWASPPRPCSPSPRPSRSRSTRREHCDRAAALIDALPDEELGRRIDAISNLTAAELYLDRFEQCAERGRRGLELARQTGQSEFFFVLTQTLGVSAWISGREVSSRVEVARLVEHLERDAQDSPSQ